MGRVATGVCVVPGSRSQNHLDGSNLLFRPSNHRWAIDGALPGVVDPATSVAEVQTADSDGNADRLSTSPVFGSQGGTGILQVPRGAKDRSGKATGAQSVSVPTNLLDNFS